MKSASPSSPPPLDARGAEALLALIAELKRRAYRFVVPTPETHRRVLTRDPPAAADLRDVFGWNRPFEASLLGGLFDPLRAAGLVEAAGGAWRSRIRVASLDEDLLAHSSFPTRDAGAVFLGPDSYRFARLLRRELSGAHCERAVDMGGGAGVGALTLARCATVGELVMTEVNPAALFLAEVNAAAAGVEMTRVASDRLDAVAGEVDLIIANPPFIAESGRTYSDGGALLGAGAALAWARSAARRLRPGGRLVVYSGSPIVGGRDLLRQALEEALPGAGMSLDYDEIDPDIFGEELEREVYRGVERIAAVGLVARKT